jgi:hypothetical protein
MHVVVRLDQAFQLQEHAPANKYLHTQHNKFRPVIVAYGQQLDVNTGVTRWYATLN